MTAAEYRKAYSDDELREMLRVEEEVSKLLAMVAKMSGRPSDVDASCAAAVRCWDLATALRLPVPS